MKFKFASMSALLLAVLVAVGGADARKMHVSVEDFGMENAKPRTAGTTLSPVVQTPWGPVQGLNGEFIEGVYSFKGVQFGAAPMGELRWRDPQPPPSWSEVRNATTFAPGCYSSCPIIAFPKPSIMCTPTVSEDCLYLNVYTPTTDASANLPVVLFIHGGNYIGGSGGVTLYDGSRLAQRENLVVVTINYRLGVFGALYDGGDILGNFQIKDQRLAMRWIQQSIGAFGGNPNLVTITGQSAGGFSVAAHLASPKSANLFQRAIMLSDPIGLLAATPSLALSLSNHFATHVNCTNSGGKRQSDCMRAVSAEDVLLAQHKTMPDVEFQTILFFPMHWVPVIDGTELVEQPLRSLQTGNWNKVPTIVSTVANESVQFVYDAITFPLNRDELYIVEDALWDNATIGEGVRQTYGFPPESVTDTRMFVSPTVTDYLFYCSGRWAAQGMAASVAGTSTNIFVNFFDYIASWNDWVFGEHMPYCVNEVCHAQDLAAIFFPFYAAPANLNPPTPKPDEIALANMVQRMWGNFARTGNPSIPTLNYPAYNATSTFVMNVSIPSGIIPEFRNHYCDFWATAGYYHF